MSDERAGSTSPADGEPQRTHDFDTAKPIELDIGNSLGSINIELADTALTHVEVRHDPESGGVDWRESVAGLLNWVNDRFHEASTGGESRGASTFDDPQDRRTRYSAEAAVRHTRVELTGNRLVVRTPGSASLRTAPLAITIRAPQDSRVGIRTGSGPVAVTGPSGRVDIHSGTGPVSVEQAGGRTAVRSGSGTLRLGRMDAELHARSGSGDIEVASINGAASVGTSTGTVWLGEVQRDVLVRTGSGDVTVADASAGQIELISGSGELRVCVRHGVTAEIDLTSSTGTANSDLSVNTEAPAHEPGLRIFGRTGNGDALLTPAV